MLIKMRKKHFAYFLLTRFIVIDDLNAHLKADDVHHHVQKVVYHLLKILRRSVTPPFFQHLAWILRQLECGKGKGYVQCLVVFGIDKLMI